MQHTFTTSIEALRCSKSENHVKTGNRLDGEPVCMACLPKAMAEFVIIDKTDLGNVGGGEHALGWDATNPQPCTGAGCSIKTALSVDGRRLCGGCVTKATHEGRMHLVSGAVTPGSGAAVEVDDGFDVEWAT